MLNKEDFEKMQTLLNTSIAQLMKTNNNIGGRLGFVKRGYHTSIRTSVLNENETILNSLNLSMVMLSMLSLSMFNLLLNTDVDLENIINTYVNFNILIYFKNMKFKNRKASEVRENTTLQEEDNIENNESLFNYIKNRKNTESEISNVESSKWFDTESKIPPALLGNQVNDMIQKVKYLMLN